MRKIRWFHRMANGEVGMYKAFFFSLPGFAILNIAYLRVMGAASVYESNIFQNDLLLDKSTLELLFPAILLAIVGILMNFYSTITFAGVWQAADRYVGNWPIWPNLEFFAVMIGTGWVFAESLVGLNIIFTTIAKVWAGAPVM